MNLHRDTPLLATTEQRFRALADLSPDAILIHSGGRFVYANQAGRGLLAPRAGRSTASFPRWFDYGATAYPQG